MKKFLAMFDLDGTLFDTTAVNFRAYKEALNVYGFELDWKYFLSHCDGRHYTDFLPEIMGGKMYLDEVHSKKKELYKNNLGAARENIHLFNIIKLIKEKYYTAVVTTASRQNAMDILSYFHRGELFDAIITQEDTIKTKPDPEGYLLAMQRFAIKPESAIIFEDSPIGIKAAQATGASVFVVNKF